MSAAEPKVQDLTVAVLLDRVREIAPILEGSAPESEAERHLADASVEAFHATELFKLWWPRELGGPGATVAEGIAVVEALAEIETVAAWNLAIGTTHGGFAAAYLADHAVKTIFSSERVVIAGQMAPLGSATRVEGGLQVSGRWSFGSGIHQSNWVLGGVKIEDGNGAVEPAVVYVPKAQAVVDEQSWKVAGLSGTGSADYTMTDVHIPDGFWHGFPMARRLRGESALDLPIPAQTITLHGAFALGAARRSLREITELAKTKMRAFSPGAVGGRMTFQRDLAESEARLAAARLYIYDIADRLQAATLPEMPRLFLETRAACRFVTDVALDIATWAFRTGGGNALRLNSPLQRILRDLMAASQHVFVDEIAYTGYGAQLLDVQS